MEEQNPFFLFDSDTRIIGDFLVCACQAVEKRRFSAVWVAHQNDGVDGMAGLFGSGFAFRRIHDRF